MGALFTTADTAIETQTRRAWARFFHDQFDDALTPEALVLLAMKLAFRAGFAAGLQCANQSVEIIAPLLDEAQ